MKCEMCGICCKLFLINLNREEYDSENFTTIFEDLGKMDFKKASECGANFLAKNKDGSCIYLKNKKCSIHEKRPAVCREFFCGGKEKKFKGMREQIAKEKRL